MPMDRKGISDDEFLRKYDSYDSETIEDFIKRYSRTEAELRETIDYLIRHREILRDIELDKLEAESRRLLDRLNETALRKMLEEIKCFKDVLALQRKLLDNDGVH